MSIWGWVEDNLGGGLEESPKISIFDSGFTLGFGIFETLKTRDTQIQFLDAHLRRMANTAKQLSLSIPTNEHIANAARAVLDANAPEHFGRLRISLTGGTFAVTSWSLVISWQPIAMINTPARLTVSTIKQFEERLNKSMKTLSYLENAYALNLAQRDGFDDAILFDTKERVSETALANIFIVKGGVIQTPHPDTGCLLGITRELILSELSKSFRLEEATLYLSDLELADEVFITSSIRDIQSVAAIDRWQYSAPGETTQQLQDAFAKVSERGFE